MSETSGHCSGASQARDLFQMSCAWTALMAPWFNGLYLDSTTGSMLGKGKALCGWRSMGNGMTFAQGSASWGNEPMESLAVSLPVPC